MVKIEAELNNSSTAQDVIRLLNETLKLELTEQEIKTKSLKDLGFTKVKYDTLKKEITLS